MLRQILFLLFTVFVFTVECRSPRDGKCLQPLDPGPCYGHMPKFAFDSDKSKCINFVYGGCAGNDNRFDSLESCEDICRG